MARFWVVESCNPDFHDTGSWTIHYGGLAKLEAMDLCQHFMRDGVTMRLWLDNGRGTRYRYDPNTGRRMTDV